QSLASILRVTLPDKYHDLAALRQDLLYDISGLAARSSVIGAYVAKTIALRSIAVLCYQDRLFSDIVQHPRLICRVHRADGYAFQPFRKQIIDYPALLGGSTVRGYPEFNIHIRQFRGCLFSSSSRNGPEIR